MRNEILKTNLFSNKPMTINEPIKVANQIEEKIIQSSELIEPEKKIKTNKSSYQGRELVTSNIEASSIIFETKDTKKMLFLLQNTFNKLPEDVKNKLGFNLNTFIKNIDKLSDKSNTNNKNIIELIKNITQSLKSSNKESIYFYQENIKSIISKFSEIKVNELENSLKLINLNTQDKEKIDILLKKIKDSSKNASISYLGVGTEFINKLIFSVKNNKPIQDFIEVLDKELNVESENIEINESKEINKTSSEDNSPTLYKLESLKSPAEIISSNNLLVKTISVKPNFELKNKIAKAPENLQRDLTFNSLINLSKKDDFDYTMDLNIISLTKKILTKLNENPSKSMLIQQDLLNKIELIMDKSLPLSIQDVDNLKNNVSDLCKVEGVTSQSLVKFKDLIIKSKYIKGNKDIVTEKYLSESKNVNNCATQLQIEIKKLRPEQQNGFTKTISELLEKYEIALKSGDVTKIAMYSALIEKILARVREGKTEEQEKNTGKTIGQDISDLITEYDNLVNRSFSSDDKTILDDLKKYLGEDRYNLILNSAKKEQNSQNYEGSNNVSKGKNDDDIVLNHIRNSIGVKTSDGKITKPKPIISNELKQELSKVTSRNMIDLFKNNPDFKKAFDNFEESNKKFIDAQINLSRFLIKINDIFVKPNKKDDFVEQNLREELRKLIEKVEIMEENLNLDVNIGETTIVTLLEKFRDIINKLDIDTRNNISKRIESLLISQRNDLYIRDMKLRLESLDKAKIELNNIIKEIKEEKII
jgi:hypothetical protein